MMRTLKKMLVPIVSVAVVLSAGALCGQQAIPPPNLKDVGFDQRLNEQVPLDLAFVDESGRPVRLGDYFKGKPVVLICAYYKCPMLCPLVFKGITRGLSKVPFDIGKDYEVVTVSFDPRETPALAAANKKDYVARYDRPGAEEGWHFLTGKEDAIEKLTQAVGFRYVYDPKKDMFNHAAGIAILTPTGKISRYLFGVDFSPRDLRLALVEASANKIGSPADQVLLYCFHYDPSTGKYAPAIARFIQTGAVLIIAMVASVAWFAARTHRRRAAKRAAAAAAAPAGPAAEPPNTAEGGAP
jgi:protein SCO1/2